MTPNKYLQEQGIPFNLCVVHMEIISNKNVCMEELFRKFLDNQCSPEEVKKLLSFFSLAENEVLLRKLINESIANNVGDKRYPPANILEEMKRQIDEERYN